MVVTNDFELYQSVKYHKNLCFPLDAPREYIHKDIGFNYRISNIHAAIGLAQVENAEVYRELRVKNGHLYKLHLADIPGLTFQSIRNDVEAVYWMNGIVVDESRYGRNRTQLVAKLKENGIETRPFFSGMNTQPALLNYGCDSSNLYPVTDQLSANGFYLPSASSLKEEEIIRICNIIRVFKNK
jgi:perosamine synthetase